MAEVLEQLVKSAPILIASAAETEGGVTEGPLWHPAGFLTFVRLDLSELVQWDADHGARVIRTGTGNGNGCTFDREGRMVICEAANRRVSRTEPDGSTTVIAEVFRGLHLNSPNDVVCASDGTIYFTDPQGFNAPADGDLGFSGIYRAGLGGELDLVAECDYPNGLAFSPDESVLYVANTRANARCNAAIANGDLCAHRALLAFDVKSDGQLGPARRLVDMTSGGPGHPDGLKVDKDGRVYCTGPGGVWVIDPAGRHLATIELPEEPVRNLAFGGPSLTTLFLTAARSVYAMEMTVPGLPGHPYRAVGSDAN